MQTGGQGCVIICMHIYKAIPVIRHCLADESTMSLDVTTLVSSFTASGDGTSWPFLSVERRCQPLDSAASGETLVSLSMRRRPALKHTVYWAGGCGFGPALAVRGFTSVTEPPFIMLRSRPAV